MHVAVDTVGRDVGRILQAVSLLLAASVAVVAVNGEFFAIPAFVVSAAVMGGIGTGLARLCRGARPPKKPDAMVTAATAWAVVGVLGALPFVLVAWTMRLHLLPGLTPPLNATTRVFLHPLNAVFETISGFTGTGLTMATTEGDLPRALHWWRSLTEWVGGVGVIVLTVAILRRGDGSSGSYTLYESEARSEKIHPSIITTVQEIWRLFVGLTLGAIALLLLAGMPPWDAINHGMTGIATGGFAVRAGSIGAYNSPAIEYATVPIMIAGSIAFPVHYLLFTGDLRNVYADLQTRWVVAWFAVGAAVLSALLFYTGQYDSLAASFRIGLFQFVSATSNTGFGTTTIGRGTERVWQTGPTLFACLGMLTGAAAGSTVSGIKLIRVITLIKGTAWQIRDVFRPASAIRSLRIGDRKLSEHQAQREYAEATLVFVLWLAFLAIGVAVLLAALSPQHPLEYVLFDVMSAQSNVGLDAGITSPGMPALAKGMLIINMWVGRLEIIPIAVLISAVLRHGDFYR
ncbi:MULTISPECIES: TrkH family potassium uptake protein [Halobacterium]|uniref:TRK potassium uptake system protein n=5 Tax=Halobacterium salinarum TaxID=2242 RepID=Q9HMF7_HALSA|nr:MULTISPECIES: TrkH family potassium uptake protein [Halobacterium]AAG20614.1 TRK potassium uptake system protein [Halobacterium salinarum NRC-1]MBB6089452.1 trk system potassium uptake protein TrkH [Halobacterium salinarum]MCF2164563.1 TrkH family potassium uptake protein [Halobacterium salinarum]MCF2166990.1 TrkH family potassium uptake protein [Halobacterium salinarum]MDL0126907.1 TrkH family potassium uptake protein [Halobacterium salinarum]